MRIATTPEIERLAKDGAWFCASMSGGKDSTAAAHATHAWLDGMGHPRDRRLMLHADLGRAEWPDTLETVRTIAHAIGQTMEVVTSTHDLVWRFGDRWRRSLVRYAALETIALTPPWSSSNSLFCRSEQKASRLSRRKAALPGDLPVVGIVGIRRQESTGRSKAAIVGPDTDMMRRNGRAGLLWNPIVDWTADEVFAYHREHGLPLHRAYGLGSTRLSCALCTLSSRGDQMASVVAGGNIAQFRAYVSIEIASAFPFQPSRWLADLVEDDQTDHRRLDEAKRMAAERMAIQATIPKSILKAKSIRNIAVEDAAALAAARSSMSRLYGIDVVGTTADAIMAISKAEEEV